MGQEVWKLSIANSTCRCFWAPNLVQEGLDGDLKRKQKPSCTTQSPARNDFDWGRFMRSGSLSGFFIREVVSIWLDFVRLTHLADTQMLTANTDIHLGLWGKMHRAEIPVQETTS